MSDTSRLLALQPDLPTLGIDDLIAMEIPSREMLLDPILPAKGLAMIHARRGGSKTFLALATGLAVAAGTRSASAHFTGCRQQSRS
jgi:putative DNA primase/helicase